MAFCWTSECMEDILHHPASSFSPSPHSHLSSRLTLQWLHRQKFDLVPCLIMIFLLLALFLSHCKHLLYVTLLSVPLSPLRCPWTSAESMKHRITSTRSLTSSWQVPAWILKLLVMVNFLLKQHLHFQITLHARYPTLSNTLSGF